MSGLRAVPIRRSLWRPELFFGADRLAVLLLSLIAATLVFVNMTWPSAMTGAAFWVIGLHLLRRLAKADPLMLKVARRHLTYQGFYPARSTPFAPSYGARRQKERTLKRLWQKSAGRGLLPLDLFKKKQRQGTPDLLNYAAVIDDGIVLGKDGALMAGWLYRGADHGAASDAQRNAAAMQVNEALATLGDGWMTHHDSIRAPVAAYPAAGASAFPDPITRLIDAERRAYFEQPGRHFESVHVLVVTYLPPKKTAARLERYVFTGEAAPSLGDMALAKFRSVLNELEGRLGALFQMERLRGERVEDAHGQTHIRDPLLSYFHWCITGIRQPINLPPVPMYLDAVIGGQDLSGGTAPKIGAQHIRVVAIEGFPQESYPGILAALDEIPVYCRWSTRFIYLDPWNAQKGLERFRRMWEQKQRPLTDQIFNKASTRIDLDAQAMTDDALEAKSEASSNVVRYGYLTSVVVLMDEALAAVDAAADEVATLIRNLGFGARIETVNALEAWLGSLSGHGSANLRRPPLNTLNLAHLVPLSTVWTGLDHCPCPFYPPDSPPLMVGVTDGSTPFHFNLHVGDVGHALILGPIGSGKSTLLAMLMAQFRRYPGATIFAFDKQCSAYTICVAAGGRHYDLSAETGALGLAPLSRLESAADIAWAAGWIEMLVRLQGVSMAPRRREEIHRALVGLREKPDPRLRTVSDFCAEVQDDEVRLALRPYRLGGAFGALFDAEEDGIKDEDFQVFELDELMKLGEQAVLPALSYLFYRIKLRLRGQPALIPLDECWMMFDHPVFREELREWLKEFRRANGAVVMATQSPADAIDSGIFDVINESCHTKILLANPDAVNDSVKPKYRLLDLNDRQIETVAAMSPKRDYYCVSPNGRRRFRLDLGPIALAFAGVSGREEIQQVRQLIQAQGPGWQLDWLRRRGVKIDGIEGLEEHAQKTPTEHRAVAEA